MFIQSLYNQTCISMHQFDVVLYLIGWEDIYKTEKQNIMKLISVYSEHCFKLCFITFTTHRHLGLTLIINFVDRIGCGRPRNEFSLV